MIEDLLHGRALRANLSTQSAPSAGADALSDVDTACRSVVALVLEKQRCLGPGSTLPVPGCKEAVILRRLWTMAELTRLKRQFIGFAKQNPPKDTDDAVASFVAFLNNAPV